MFIRYVLPFVQHERNLRTPVSIHAGVMEGHPSVEGAKHQEAGQAESGSDRKYLNGLVEATALASHDQVRINCYFGGEVAIGRAVATLKGVQAILAAKIGALNLSRSMHFSRVLSDIETRLLIARMQFHLIKRQFFLRVARWSTPRVQTQHICVIRTSQVVGLDSSNHCIYLCPVPFKVANVAFVKTHKTASTTLAAIMYRYAARHDLKVIH